jgi:twinkle protein
VTPDSLIKTAKGLVQKYGVRGVLMDPWNEFLHQVPSNKREDQYLAEVLGKITRFARECDVHVWIVAHPHQMEKDRRDGTYPVVKPYDINGGAMFHNKTFNMLSVHRPDSGAIGYTEIHVQKIKFWGETGYPGMVGLILDPITGQYSQAVNN